MKTYTDENKAKINAHEGNILKWDGHRRRPSFPGCTNSVDCAYVKLTLVDGSTTTLRDEEAERFLTDVGVPPFDPATAPLWPSRRWKD